MATAIVSAPMWSMYEKPQPAGGWSGRPELKVSPETACTIGPQVLNARVRAGGAEAGVRHVDDVGLDRPQLLVGEAHAREHAGGEVLGDHVGDGDELAQQLLAALGAQVERDPELLDVVVVEAATDLDAAPVVDERRRAAHDVPRPLAHRVLDADHLGAERGEEPGRPGARELAAEVADAEVRQRRRPAFTRHATRPHRDRRTGRGTDLSSVIVGAYASGARSIGGLAQLRRAPRRGREAARSR